MASCIHFAQHAMAPGCLLCAGRGAGKVLCTRCHDSLPTLAPAHCDTCAVPVTAGTRCGACLSQMPSYEHVCAPYVYAFPVDALVLGLKYRGMLTIAPVLGAAIAGSLDERPDVLVPMPLAGERLRERGFNQSLEIARHLARASGIPLMPQACRRVRNTPPQAALPWKERAKNIRRAFVCDADFSGRHVAVVDDVMTTGATLNELARNLKRAGAARVTGLVAARTLPGSYTRRHANV